LYWELLLEEKKEERIEEKQRQTEIKIEINFARVLFSRIELN
jgi:hypothetical protein